MGAEAMNKVTVKQYREALAAQPRFCDLCGTTLPASKADTTSGKCKLCRAAICGPMIWAYTLWKEMGERYRRCCGGFNSERTYLYFHGKGFENSYPLTRKGKPIRRGPQVEVEFGVAFYADHAQPYYLRDFDHHCDSQDYGDPVIYATSPGHVITSGEEFWKEVERQFDDAAKAAWESDLLTCRKCGYHYGSDVGVCSCEGGM
jgi:hypothetical protein